VFFAHWDRLLGTWEPTTDEARNAPLAFSSAGS
jgi:sterol desaturase/sphingolipid hydroxylase (fatty acid hydroxylase superfamily)